MISRIAVALLTCLAATSALSSGTCTKIEYAELKDTPNERLVALYCKYQALAKLEQDTRNKLTAIGATRDARSHGDEEVACYEEMSKIARVLKNLRQVDATPACQPK